MVFAVSVLGAQLTQDALAIPVPVQAEAESLQQLVLNYLASRNDAGPEHPSVKQLRTMIDQKLKAGERLNVEDLSASLKDLKLKFSTARKQLSDSDPNLVLLLAKIESISAILAHQPEDIGNLDALTLNGDAWNSDILYVPERRITGQISNNDPEATEITLNKGSDQGIKAGFHFHVFSLPAVRVFRWQPDFKKVTVIQVTSVEPTQSQAKIISSSDNKPLAKELIYQTPAFPLGTLILAAHFDEAAWNNKPLMKAFLNELFLNCVSKSAERPILLVVDSPSTACEIEAQPVGPNGFNQDQQGVVEEVKTFLKEQPYFQSLELKERPLAPKANKPEPDRSSENQRVQSYQRIETMDKWPSWDGNRTAETQRVLDAWQKAMLQGVKPEVATERLSALRTEADDAEKVSIAKAAAVREAMRANTHDAALIDKLKADLRSSVDDAFKARQRVQRLEIIALTMKFQAVLDNYSERTKPSTQTAIVDRRVDDLLNPNFRWESTSLAQESERPKSSTHSELQESSASGSVEGLVTFRGKPIEGELVLFGLGLDSSDRVSTTIASDGKFQIASMPVGKFRVTITDSRQNLSKKFSDQDSPLQCEILPGKNVMNFELQ